MPGRTPAEACERFIGPIQRALTCLDHVKVTLSPGGAGGIVDREHSWTLNSGEGLALVARDAEGEHVMVLLHASMKYRFSRTDAGDWKVSTIGYAYHLTNELGKEVLLHHWHPGGSSTVDSPHLHVGAAVILPSGVLTSKTHVPTARTSVESVVRMLIDDMGVDPHKPDYDRVLAESEGIFELYRSWR